MNFKNIAVGTLLVAGLTTLPVSALAMSHSCVAGKAATESYTRNFKAEASRLLDQVRADAVKAQDQAELIKSFNLEPISWQSHAAEWSAIKGEISDMGGKLCRLEQIRRMVAPWQQQAIDRDCPAGQVDGRQRDGCDKLPEREREQLLGACLQKVCVQRGPGFRRDFAVGDEIRGIRQGPRRGDEPAEEPARKSWRLIANSWTVTAASTPILRSP